VCALRVRLQVETLLHSPAFTVALPAQSPPAAPAPAEAAAVRA